MVNVDVVVVIVILGVEAVASSASGAIVDVVVERSGDRGGDCVMGRPVLGFIITLLLPVLLLLAVVVVGIILCDRAAAASTLPETATTTTPSTRGKTTTCTGNHLVKSRCMHGSNQPINESYESLWESVVCQQLEGVERESNSTVHVAMVDSRHKYFYDRFGRSG